MEPCTEASGDGGHVEEGSGSAHEGCDDGCDKTAEKEARTDRQEVGSDKAAEKEAGTDHQEVGSEGEEFHLGLEPGADLGCHYGFGDEKRLVHDLHNEVGLAIGVSDSATLGCQCTGVSREVDTSLGELVTLRF